MYIKLNVNPVCRRGDDCTVRAIATALDKTWEQVYVDLCVYGLKEYDMPSSNHVWGAYLLDKGWKRQSVPNSCPLCYTVKQFADEHPEGRYILALHGHVVACVSGCYMDSWDSGQEVVVYYWEKED